MTVKHSLTKLVKILQTLNGRVDGLEAQQNNFEAGSFSDTTTLDGKAVFTVGCVDTEGDANRLIMKHWKLKILATCIHTQ